MALDTTVARQAGKAAVNAAEEAITPAAREEYAALEARMKAAQASNIGKQAVKPQKSITDRISGAWNAFGKYAMVLSLVGGGAGMLAGKLSQGGKIASALGGFQKTTALLNTSTKDVVPAVKAITGESHVIGRAAERTSKSISAFAEKTMGNSSWGQKALTNLKENQLATTVFTVGGVVQGVGSMYFTFKDKAKTLQQMHFDLTGEKISKWKALTGKVDPFVAQARKSEVSSGRAIGATALEGAGILGNLGLALFGKDGGTNSGRFGAVKYMAMSMGFTAVPGIASSVMRSGDTALQAYNAMYQSFAVTGKADIELYKGVIGGLNKAAPDKLVNEIAQRAFEKQMPPGDVLKMLKETDFLKKPQSAVAAVKPVEGKSFVAAENARRSAANNGAYAMQA